MECPGQGECPRVDRVRPRVSESDLECPRVCETRGDVRHLVAEDGERRLERPALRNAATRRDRPGHATGPQAGRPATVATLATLRAVRIFSRDMSATACF